MCNFHRCKILDDPQDLRLDAQFLALQFFEAVGHLNKTRIAQELNVPVESVNRWLSGKRRPSRSLNTIAHFLFENFGGSDPIVFEAKFIEAWTYLCLCEDGKPLPDGDPPELVPESLRARIELRAVEECFVARGSQAAPSTDDNSSSSSGHCLQSATENGEGQDNYEYDQRSASDEFDEDETSEQKEQCRKNYASQLSYLDGEGWTQKPLDGSDFELEAELFCGQISRALDGRRIRYGLREVHIRVTSEDFESIHRYHGGDGNLPAYVHLHRDKTWKIHASNGPTDNFGLLDGRVLAGPLCSAKHVGKGVSALSLDVYVPQTTPKLLILADNSDNEVAIDDQTRRNLIEKMYLIYLHKLHQLDGENILLSSSSVST